MPWIKRPKTDGELCDCSPYVWEDPSHAKRDKLIAAGKLDPGYTVAEFTLVPGGVLAGWNPPKPLPRLTEDVKANICASGSVDEHYRLWCDGKIEIPGLKVKITTPAGEFGPCKVVKGQIVPLKRRVK